MVTSIASSYRLYKAPRSFHLVKSTKRSIYGETPEGTGQAEDRGPQQIGFRKESLRTTQVGVAETAP